jgi:prolyl-tRNA synthetase
MRQQYFSNLLLKTYRQAPTNVIDPTHSLLIRSSLMTQLDSGVYIFNTPMVIYLDKLTNYIKNRMDSLFSEVSLPTLTPIDL